MRVPTIHHRRGGALPDMPVVTLAELYGAGGSQIGRLVAGRLRVQFLDSGISRSVAQRTGIPEGAVAEVDQHPRSRWSQLVDALGRASPPTGASEQVERLDLQEHGLHREVERFLGEASRSGAVVLGRGSGIVLAAVPRALHVYLGGNREGRIERVMNLYGTDQATASRQVKQHDRARLDYVKSVYGVDGDDPTLYHLVIDAVSLGIDVCVDVIVAASASLTRHPLQATPRDHVRR